MFHKQLSQAILVFILLAISQWAAAGESNPPPFVEGEVLVKFKEAPSKQRALHYREAWRMSEVRTFRKSGIRKVKLPEDVTVDQAIALYRSDPDVLYAEPNYRYRIQAVADDPRLDQLWGLNNDGQWINGSSGTPGADMDVVRAWDLETGSRKIVVAVVDSGVDLNHPDLAANLWINPDETPDNGLDDDNNGYVDDIHGWDFADNDNLPLDAQGHGTHVAGIIGAVGNNGKGITGVCWQVGIMPLRFITATQYGTTADAIEAIEYADDKQADIINLSWGGTHYSQALKDAIDAADALVVCAAGNEGYDLDVTPLYPASYNSFNILSVAASDADDYPAWFTSYSAHQADVMAPGINILSTSPDRRAIWTEDLVSLENWTLGGTQNHWGLKRTTDGRQVLSVSADGTDYGNTVDSWAAIAEPLNLSGRTGVRMDFQVTGVGADDGDRLTVEISTDRINWTSLRLGLEDNGTTHSISGVFTTWQSAAVDLGMMDGTSAVYLRFRFASNASGTAAGYSIAEPVVTCASTTGASDTYQYYNGTSMSAAYASGVAALVLTRKPTLTPAEVRLLMETSVDRKPQLIGYVSSAGRLNASNALESVANVALKTNTLASDQIGLDWASQGVAHSGFEIWRRAGNDGDFVTIAVAGADDVGYTDRGLSADTTYVYRILTLNGETRTGYSNEASATTFSAAVAESSNSGGGGGGGGCFISALIGTPDALDPMLID